MCLDHIAMDGLGGGEAAEAADDGMAVALVLVAETKMGAVEELVRRKRQQPWRISGSMAEGTMHSSFLVPLVYHP